MNIDYQKFENSELLKKLFNSPIIELEKSNILLPSELPNIFTLLLGFDEMFSKLRERADFYKNTFLKVKENKINFYKEKQKFLKSSLYENEQLEFKRNIEFLECNYKIKNLELSKKFKTFNLNEDGDIMAIQDFNLIRVIRDMQNIINQNAFSAPTRVRLQNIVSAPASSETLKDIIFGMLKNENDNTTTILKKN